MVEPAPETLPEPELNELLRRVDWRFLSAHEEAPLIADLTAGRDSRAVRLVSRGEPVPGAADIAVTGFPSRLALGAARDAVRLGGEVVCLWRTPRLGGARRAAARLRRAGLADVRLLWAGPRTRDAPQFWLPLGSSRALAHLLAGRPARSRRQSLARLLWRAAAAIGLLAPVCAIARVPDPEGAAAESEIAAPAAPDAATLLLTGGGRSINKVVALSFAEEVDEPAGVVKFARVAAADAALEREAEVLRRVAREHPGVAGVPRLLAVGRRAGRRAVAESAVFGRPLLEQLSPATFAQLAGRVSEWLGGLVGAERPAPESWRERLVEAPLACFEREFGLVAPGVAAAARQRLDRLGPLPPACEHRDCSPWNLLIDDDGALGLLDWESAEPDGLPGLDLVYFLANAAFVLDGALESGATRPVYARLLDPDDPRGEAFAAHTAEYCSRAGMPSADFDRLRLLCWIVHSHSDYRHLEMAAAGPPSPEALRGSAFLGLVEEELARGASGGRR